MAESKLKFSADTASATKGIKGLEGNLDGLKNTAQGLGAALKSALLPLAAIGGAVAIGSGIKNLVSGFIDYVDELDDASQITGIAVAELAKLQKVAELANVPFEKLTKSVTKLSVGLDDPTADMKVFLNEWNISESQIKNSTMGQRFEMIRKAISGIGSETEQVRALTTFFGKVGADLRILVNDTNLGKIADTILGNLPLFAEESAEAITKLKDAIGGLREKFLALAGAAAVEILPVIKTISDMLMNINLEGIGTAIGQWADRLVNAFQDGRIWDFITQSITDGFFIAGRILLGIFEAGAFIMLQAFRDELKGTILGDILGNGQNEFVTEFPITGLSKEDITKFEKEGFVKERYQTGPEPYDTETYLVHRRTEGVGERIQNVLGKTWDDTMEAVIESKNNFMNQLRGSDPKISDDKLRVKPDNTLKDLFGPVFQQAMDSRVFSDSARATEFTAWQDSVRKSMTDANKLAEEQRKNAPMLGWGPVAEQISKTQRVPDAHSPIVSRLASIGGARGEVGSAIQIQRDQLTELRGINNKMGRLNTGFR